MGLANSFVAGTAAGMSFMGASAAVVVGSCALLSWALARHLARRHRLAHILGVVALHVAVAGVAALSATLAVLKRERELTTLRDVIQRGGKAVIHGTVVTEPTGSQLPNGGTRLSFDVRVHELPDTSKDRHSEPFILPVAWYGPASILGPNPSRPVPRAGEGWELKGRLREASRERGAPRITLHVGGQGCSRWPDEDVHPWLMAGWDLRRVAADSLGSGIEHSPQTAAILRAMILGYRSEMPNDLRAIFADSGTIHIFAISGLHVCILASLLSAVLPMTRLPQPLWGWLLGPLLVLYTLISGSSPSAVRACLMSLLVFGGPLLGRKPVALSSLAAAAVLILVFAPLQLGSLAFLFSFACVAALLVGSPVLLRLWTPSEEKSDEPANKLAELVREAEWAASPGLLPHAEALPWWRRWLRGGIRFVRGSMAISVAAWLASAPITAICFGRISPISVIGNLFAVPLSTGIVLCGSLSLVGGLVSPWFAITFNCASLALTELLVALTRLILRIPGAAFVVTPWPAWVAAPWYAGCVVATLLLRIHLRRRDLADGLSGTSSVRKSAACDPM